VFHVKHPQDETIAAIATPLGIGGVGVIRVSGDGAGPILRRLFVSSNGTEIESHKMLHGWLVEPKTGEKADEVLACFMQSPSSYTGEDVAEFYCHGGMAIVQKALSLALESGARLAQKGEFTKRAFLNRKLDLAQAEAVLDLVAARTAEGAGLAVSQLEGRLSRTVNGLRDKLVKALAELEAFIDFPDDLPELDYNGICGRIDHFIEEIDRLLDSAGSGRVYREGLPAVIIGKPNVGKSSLLNALLEEERAIVTDIPGTTRDAIEETISIYGLPLRIIDTAGIRHPKDRVEEFGVERTERELGAADFTLIVVDVSSELDDLDKLVLDMAIGKHIVVVLNKADLGVRANLEELRSLAGGAPTFMTCALSGEGIDSLKTGIFDYILSNIFIPSKDAVIINSRHKECLLRARGGLVQAGESLRSNLPADFVAIDLKAAIVALGEVTGELVSEEVVNAVFDQFCVGK
jgi:tRNA modification GTPase